MVKRPHSVDVHVGRTIRRRRQEVGLSQEKLSASLGITFQQVQKYEKGSNRVSSSRLQQIADVLEVSVAYFFDDTPANRSITSTVSSHFVDDFVSDPTGLALVRAFTRISDRQLRRRIVALVHRLSEMS